MGKVAVLGLGDSLKLYDPEKYDISIGVNDIWRYQQTDVIVCLDKRKAFTHDRLVVIDASKPKDFYSQVANWNIRNDFRQIQLTSFYPATDINLDLPKFYKSYCSPFVACQIAWRYYGATEIHLFGVDFINHPHLKPEHCRSIKNHFNRLVTALDKKGCKFIVYGEGILNNM